MDRQRDSQIERRGGRCRQMYTTQNNRQIERQIDREEEVGRDRCIQLRYREEGEVGTDRCIQNKPMDRKSDCQMERKGRQVQIDVYNIEQQIDREIVRQRGGGGRYRQIDVHNIGQQIDREFIA